MSPRDKDATIAYYHDNTRYKLASNTGTLRTTTNRRYTSVLQINLELKFITYEVDLSTSRASLLARSG